MNLAPRTSAKFTLFLPALIAGLCILSAVRAPAQNLATLHPFAGPDGYYPEGGVVLSGSKLYGTTSGGGAYGFGTIFSVNIDGTGFATLYNFTYGSDGAFPYANLILSGGTLYGTAVAGGNSGAGTVFRINTNGGGFTTLYSFTGGNDGDGPYAGLVQGGNVLYGATYAGGSNFSGTIFSLTTTGSNFKTLYTFSAQDTNTGTNFDGASPDGTLMLSGGVLYGTAAGGGTSDAGTVFSLTTTGTNFTNLHNFGFGDGYDPEAGLVLSGSTLFGTTVFGGATGNGVVYTLSTSGSGFADLYNFTGGIDGASPYGGVLQASGLLYGATTSGGALDSGALYNLNTNGTGFATLYSFTGTNDGGAASSSLVLSNNILYGTTQNGGASDEGTVFAFTLSAAGPTVPVTVNFVVTSAFDVSQFTGNETDPAVAINPFVPTNIFVAAVPSTTNGLFASYTTNGWKSKTTGVIATGTGTSSNLVAAYGEPTVAWDSNSNLFLAYIPSNYQGVAVAYSTNAGKTFSALTNLVPNDATDQPRITAGVFSSAAGSVWLVYKDYSVPGTPLVAQGLQTTNLGAIGSFGPPFIVPGSSNGGFPDIAIGPNNQLMVAYQDNIDSSSTSHVFVSVNNNTLLTNGFGPPITVTSDAIGGLTYIPAVESGNGINAGVGLAWDENPTSLYYGRAYVVYTGGTPPATEVYTRYSGNSGTSWSSELQVNDDHNSMSHFFPRIALDATTGSLALCWYDCRNDTGASANQIILISNSMVTNFYTNIFDLDSAPNDDFMVYGTASLSGGINYASNQPMLTIWTSNALNAQNPPAGEFVYSSETDLANNPNGLGHYIGLAYDVGSFYPVWADNSDYLPPGGPSANPGPLGTFDIYTAVGFLPTANLAIGLFVSPTNPTSQESIVYTIVVTNLGPSPATNVLITNVLPANVSFVTAHLAAGGTESVNGQTVIFSFSTLGPHAVITNTIIGSPSSGIAVDTASVGSILPDPFPGNNIAINSVVVSGEDLGLTMSASLTNADLGQPITFTLTVTNLGPATNGQVVITNVLSANLGLVTNVNLPQGTYVYFTNNNTIVFNLGPVNTNVSYVINYTATAVSPGSVETVAINSAQVSSADYDPNLFNNSASVILNISGETLGFGLSSSPSSVTTGQPITYVEIVTNLGPATNGIISVTNAFSQPISSFIVLRSPGSYSFTPTSIIFNDGTLGVNQTATNIFTAAPSLTGVVTNEAVVVSSDFDTNAAYTFAETLTTVIAPPPPIINFTVIPSGSSAILTWGTPVSATVQVAYGLTTNYGSITSISGPSTNHVVILTGLARNTNYYFNAMSWEAGTLYQTNGGFFTSNSVILNTQDAFYSGSWAEGSLADGGYYGSYYNVANETPFNPTASATYSPTIPALGLYNVYAWYPQSTNFTTNAQMFVSGTTNEVIAGVNQTTNGGNWRQIATNLYYAAGMSGNVIIYNDLAPTNVLVAANAMMWTYVASQDYLTNGVVPPWWASFYFGTNTAAANANFAAYVFGASPNNPSGTPQFWVTFPSSNTVQVAFAPFQGGRIYQLQATTDLSNPNWVTLTNQPTTSTNATGVYTDGTGYGIFTLTQSNAVQSYYRLSAQIIQE